MSSYSVIAPKLNALAGKVVEAATLEQQLAQLRHSIAFAAAAAESVGKVVLVEPLNLAETPGYLLPTVASALDLIADVGRPNVMIQFDVYHVARAGDDPVQTIARAAGHIGHVQIADLPGRHEPGTGGLPFAEIFDALRSAGYEGNVGLEYVPSNHDAPDFGYIDALDRLLKAAAGPSAS